MSTPIKLSYQEVSDTFRVSKEVSEKYLKISNTSGILGRNGITYGLDIAENENLRNEICNNIAPPISMSHENFKAEALYNDKSLSINDLVNKSIEEDHAKLKALMTDALTSYFLEQNKSKKFDDNEMKEVANHFNSLPLGQSFEMYNTIHQNKKDRKFLDKDTMMEKLKILADVHKKPVLEELKNFEVKNMGSSNIKIESPKNTGPKL